VRHGEIEKIDRFNSSHLVDPKIPVYVKGIVMPSRDHLDSCVYPVVP